MTCSTISGTLPAPSDTRGVLALGNETTCEIQGFMTVLGCGTYFYALFLSIQYCLVVCFNTDEKLISTKIEPFMHVIAIGWPLATAITGVYLDLYNFAGSQCWIAPYPTGCVEDSEVPCTRGINAYAYRWIFQGYIIAFCFLAIPGILFFIVWTVWRRERKMNSYDPSSITRGDTASLKSRFSTRLSSGSDALEDGESRTMSSILRGSRWSFGRSSFTLRGSEVNNPEGDEFNNPSSADPISQNQDRIEEGEHVSGGNQRRFSGVRRESINRSSFTEDTRRVQRRVLKRTKAVAWQGIRYSLAFYLCYVWAFVGRTIEQYTGTFPLLCLVGTKIFITLQGFLNYLIFVRNHVSRIRRKNPDHSFQWAFYQATYYPERHIENNSKSRRLSRLSIRLSNGFQR